MTLPLQLQRAAADRFGGEVLRALAPLRGSALVVGRGRHEAPVEVRFAGDSSEERELFEADLALLQTLHHPKIIAVLDQGSLVETPFYAVPYLPSLAEVLERANHPLPLDRALHLLTDIASALTHCHACGVLHYAISPHVIAASPTAFWLDGFWNAVFYGPLRSGYIEGYVLGTPTYLSPELCAGLPVDERGDIYSLGVTLFECLTGEPPYRDLRDPVAAKRQVPAFPTPSSALEARVHTLLTSMLNPVPKVRPQSAQAVLELAQALAAAS